MAIGYELESQCSTTFANSYCWDPFSRGGSLGALGFYIGAVFAAVGVILLGGGQVARLLRKL
jgi:hypothetical protein